MKKMQRRERISRMRFVPEEVLEEILVRLPVQSICKFKSVSKSWRCLIQSHYFIDLYRIRHYRDFPSKSLCCMPILKEVMHLQRPRKRHFRYVTRALGQLSNGIYGLVSYPEYDCCVSIIDAKIGLCNITTSKCKFTNPFPSNDDSYSLLTDLPNHRCRVHCSFGTTTQGEYKVIVIITWGRLFSPFLSFVYDFKRGEWTKLVDYERDIRNDSRDTDGLIVEGEVQYPEITHDLELCPQRFYNGCRHWIAILENSNCFALSFNLDSEAFKYIDAPDYEYRIDYMQDAEEGHYMTNNSVLVLKDRLRAIFFDHHCESTDVWMMMEYGVKESWTMIYTIEPNFYSELSRLVGIYWKPDEVDVDA